MIKKSGQEAFLLAVTAIFASPLASKLSDGLETAAHALGLPAGTQVFSPVFMQYTVLFLSRPFSVIMAGVAGVWICYGVGKKSC